MPDIQTLPRRRSNDVKCLKCGVFNIPENRICGRCGASLPVVYDEKGQVFRWEDAQGYEALVRKPQPKSSHYSVNKTRWILRAMVLTTAVFFAFYIMNHHG